MHDVTLIKKLSNKPLFNRLSPYIKEHAVSKETWAVIKVMKEANLAMFFTGERHFYH